MGAGIREYATESFAQIDVVSLLDNKKVKDYFENNPITGLGRFIDVKHPGDIKKIVQSDLVFLLASRDINLAIVDELMLLPRKCVVVAFTPDQYCDELREAATTYIVTKENAKALHWYIKALVENIALPSLVGLDFADVHHLFLTNRTMKVKKYKGKLDHPAALAKAIRNDFKGLHDFLFLLHGSPQLTLDFLNDVAGTLCNAEYNGIWAARFDEDVRGFELAFFAGGL